MSVVVPGPTNGGLGLSVSFEVERRTFTVSEVFGGITGGYELLGDHVEHLSGPVGVAGQMREQSVDPDERGVAGGSGGVVMVEPYPRACGS
ncbi:hypothetical protein [Nocardiopsis sp. JB363]|uniref:hypothetical protein n=1 Tax=Nocardiopsis sp. JB363 TaxID=1434837 RepID=UPI00117ED825|nr:hypothetical protein [Nocardiopsis sp. JB363]